MVDWIVLQTKITMYEALSIRQQLNMEVKKGSSHEAFTKEYRESGFTKIGIWVNRNSIYCDGIENVENGNLWSSKNQKNKMTISDLKKKVEKLNLEYENGNILRGTNGREISDVTRIEVPIISEENVWKDEFYRANQIGLRPSIRLKLSSLNYNDEEELIYMGKEYTVIRVDGDNADEVVLVCQRRANNVK